ncbi:MAG: glycoside hydrolase family 43 protein [Firmicutes bacterium]|nr:glycoside hydrolase family 43 protein [Bacillota bacterium]
MGAYLFVHFSGTESSENSEQIYFSVSEDGKKWRTLNGKKTVLVSGIGERGVRDPFIIKSPSGGKYYIIATDLSIYHRRNDGNAWIDCQTKGSRNIIVWESDDLIEWSDARAVEAAVENAGCAWAPEAMYDPERDMYIVYWASTVSDDGFKYQRVYSAYTKDFKEFTPAELYINNASDDEIANGAAASNIDTTITEYGGVYYRFTKNESNSSVIMDKSVSLSGKWEPVGTYNLGKMRGFEGPTIFKLHNESKWCLLLDHFTERTGYEPFITEDISKGVFEKSEECEFDDIYRHGSVMPITDEEYERLKNRFE